MKKQVLLWVLASGMWVPCRAAVAEETPDTVALQEVEIVANRATAKSPVAYTKVTRKELDSRNDGRDLPYMLSMTPSLTMTSDAGAGVGYSAMNIRGSDGTRINVTVNGVPINDAESHRVYWVNMPDLASSLRDVQIQRGAGTSSNGAGAFGASVNMLTDTPSRRAFAEANGSYGSYNTHRANLRVGSGLLGDHWMAEARISNIGSDGYIDRASSKLWSYFGQLAYHNGDTDLRLLGFGGKEETYMAWDYASREEIELYGRRYNPCGQYTDSEGNIAYYPDQKDYFTQHNFHLLLAQRLGDSWRLNAALHYTRGVGYYRQYKTSRTLLEYGLEPYVNAEGETIKKSDLIRLKHSNSHFGGGTVGADYTADGLAIAMGAALNTYRGHHFGEVEWVRNYIGPLDPLQQYYTNRSVKTDFSTFARATVDLSSVLSAFADLQYRHIYYRLHGANSDYDYTIEAMQPLDYKERYNFLNPKIGLTFNQGPHRAFVSWSVAHKEPTRTNFTEGDPEHLPHAERMFDYELGYTFAHPVFTVGANLYLMDYKDQLVLTGRLSDTGNPLTENVPSSYRMGIELQGAVRFCSAFEWQANATLSRNRIKRFTEYIYEDGWTNPISFYLGTTPIAFSPSFLFNNAFNFNWRGFEASLTSHYVSRQYLTNTGNREASLDPYFVSDLMLAYNFGAVGGLRKLRVGISINNLFNEKYENNGYAGAGYYVGDAGQPVIYRYAGFAVQAPTNVLATVTVHF
ncbi:MAG: TonB-dependent receptor [Muribaculaceae bacterium]|nr:TonB-dependent receptor [Muribaculaceae bacterium]